MLKGPFWAHCTAGRASFHPGWRATDEIISLGETWGYQLEWLRPQIEALAAQKG